MVSRKLFLSSAATAWVLLVMGFGATGKLRAQCCQSQPARAEPKPIRTTATDADRNAGTDSFDLREYFGQIGNDASLWFQHVQVLASPAMEGRRPGTRGIDRAADYIEYYFREYGLAPPFVSNSAAGDSADKSYRQSLNLEGEVISGGAHASTLTIGDETLVEGRDFAIASNTRTGSARGPLAFVGYAVAAGPGGYSSFDTQSDLAGRIAVVFRLEPLKDDGSFQWGDGPGTASSMVEKLKALAAKKVAGVLIVNPPGAKYELASLESISGLGGCCTSMPRIPTAMITQEAAEKILKLADPLSRDLGSWRRLADSGHIGTVKLNDQVIVELNARVEVQLIPTENVAGALSGRGRLASEWIVIGGHYDHIGRGTARAPGDQGVLLGADDNASGTAMVLLLAQRLANAYASAAADADLRSILFVAFTAEETGLLGSRHFVKNPPVPLTSLHAMLNFDAVGRLRENKLWLYGFESAAEFPEMFGALLEKSGLSVQTVADGDSSDQVSFVEAEIPALFFNTGPHDEYHTSADLADTVNPAGAARIMELAETVAMRLAAKPGELIFVDQSTTWSSWCKGNRGGSGDKPCGTSCCGKSSAAAPLPAGDKPKTKCCG